MAIPGVAEQKKASKMSHILRTSTEHITAPLTDQGNYAYCQSRGAHNIKHI